MGFKSEYDQNPHFAQRIAGILVLRIFVLKKKCTKIPAMHMTIVLFPKIPTKHIIKKDINYFSLICYPRNEQLFILMSSIKNEWS